MNALKQRWQSGCLAKVLIVGVVLFACVVCGVIGQAVRGPSDKLGAPTVIIAEATIRPVASAIPSRCVPASAGQLERVQAAVSGFDGQNEVRAAWAVKSKDFENVWMVAALIYGPGAENGVGPGVWAMNGEPDSPGLTFAVNGFAQQFSDLPDGSKTDAAINGTEDGIAEAKQCAMENR